MADSNLLQVGNSYDTPVKTYYLTPEDGETAEQALATLPKNIPSGSVCEYLTDAGLDVYMFKSTGSNSGKWILI